MNVNFSPERLTATLERVGYTIYRGFTLGEAIVGFVGGAGFAFGSAVLLQETDAELAGFIAKSTCPTCRPMTVEGARTVLLCIAFAALIYAAYSVHKIREWWLNPEKGDQP